MEELYPEYNDETNKSKLTSLMKNAPMLPIGLVALAAIVGHGVYNFRNRTVKPSLFLINYRLAAQGTFLGCITFGLAYTVLKRHVWDKMHKEEA